MYKPTKRDRDTDIYYNQSSDSVQVRTNDQKLIRKLTALSEEFPELCQLTKKDEFCGFYFTVDKRRISIQVTWPFSEERRKKQSEWAKKNGIKGRCRKKKAKIKRLYFTIFYCILDWLVIY